MTDTKSGPPRVVAVCVFLGFLALYLASFPGNDRAFARAFNVLFAADTGANALATQSPGLADVDPEVQRAAPPISGRWAMRKMNQVYSPDKQVHKVRKHLLYSYCSNALYTLARTVLGAAGGEWTIARERICVVFPSALFGSLTVLYFFLALFRYSEDLLSSALLSVLLGSSFGMWFYSSLPETYASQSFFTMVFAHALLFWKTTAWRRVLVLAAASSLAIFQGINSVLLVPVGGLYLLARKRYGQAVGLGVLSTAVVVGGYTLAASLTDAPIGILDTAEFGKLSIEKYTQEYTFTSPLIQKPLVTLVNFAMVGVAAMPLPPGEYYAVDAVRSYLTTPGSAFFLAVYVLFVALTARGLVLQARTSRDTRDRIVLLLFWLTLLWLFYSYFNAYESLLYSSLFQVPLWILYFMGFRQYASEAGRMCRLYVVTGVVCAVTVCANNLSYVFLWLTRGQA